MVPYNLMKENGKAAILIQEHGAGAIKAKPFGETLLLLLQRRKLQSHSKDIQYR
jgi:hypothetical protein